MNLIAFLISIIFFCHNTIGYFLPQELPTHHALRPVATATSVSPAHNLKRMDSTEVQVDRESEVILKSGASGLTGRDIQLQNDMLNKYNKLFFDAKSLPTSYARNMERYFPVFEAIVKGEAHHPIAVEFHVSGDCQLNCRYCVGGERRQGHKGLVLSPEEIECFIDQIIDYNKITPTSFTDIKFGGLFSDPLSSKGKPASIAGLRKAIEHDFWVGITTNGIGLDEDVARVIVGNQEKSAKLLNISIDAGTWQTYYKLKLSDNSPDTAAFLFQKAIENTKRAVRLRNEKASPLHIGMSYVLQDVNCSQKELMAAVKTAMEVGVDDISFRLPHTKSEGSPNESDIKDICEHIRMLQKAYADSYTRINFTADEEEVKNRVKMLMQGAGQKKEYKHCRAPFVRMTVGNDGRVYVCEHRAYKGGGSYAHISDGFENIVKSVERRDIVNSIRPLEDKKCKFCALHNHLTNQIINDLSHDHEKCRDFFEWLKQEYPFLGQRNTHRKQLIEQLKSTLVVIKEKKSAHPYIKDILLLENFLKNIVKDDVFLSGLNAFMSEARTYSDDEGLSGEQLLSEIQQIVRSGKGMGIHGDAYGCFKLNEDYNAQQRMRELFSDDAFLNGLHMLNLGDDEYSTVVLSSQKHLVDVARHYIQTFLGAYVSDESLEQAIDECVNDFFDLTQQVIRLMYQYTSPELKTGIKRYLPYYVQNSLDNILSSLYVRYKPVFEADIPSLERAHFYRYFTDILITCVYKHIDQLRASRFDFYERQLFITTEIFKTELRAYAERKGLGTKFYPVIFLTDAEPLSYPLLSTEKPLSLRDPIFLYLNRQSFMTEAERAEYKRSGLKHTSEHSQIEYVRRTKFLSFLERTSNGGSLVERAVSSARKKAGQWFFEQAEAMNLMQEENLKSARFSELIHQFKSDSESLFYLEAAKLFLILMKDDPEINEILRHVKENVLSQDLFNDAACSVFIDSGIKGSIAILAASLVNIESIPGKAYEDKIVYIQHIINDSGKVRSTTLPAHIYLYGALENIRDVVPNAGFGRYGHGGVNSFVEALPKFSAFDGLDEHGIPRLKRADDFSLYGADIILQGYLRLVERKNAIVHAKMYEDVWAAIEQGAMHDNKPIIAFIDLDNVVFRPQSYVGSEKWFADSFAVIPSWEESKKQEFFDYNIRHEKRLLQAGLYETVLDVTALKDKLEVQYPGRQVTFVAFSARREGQRPETEGILKLLHQITAFDSFDYSEKKGESKYQRLTAYLEKHSVDTSRSHVFFIDDAMHNIALFLKRDDITLIHYAGGQSNCADITGFEYFQQSRLQLLEDKKDYALDRFLNALSTWNMPFDADLVNEMINVGMVDENAVYDILQLTAFAESYLRPEDIEKVKDILFALNRVSLSDETLAKIHKVFGKNSFLGQLSKKLFYSAIASSNYQEQVEQFVRVTKDEYFTSEEFLKQSGISLDEFIENAVLDYAFSFEKDLEHIDYIRAFIDILSPYFSPQKIKSFFAQGAVFAGQFQWVNIPGRDFVFYYKDTYYCYMPEDQDKLIKSPTYQGLLVKNINHVLRDFLNIKSPVSTVVIYPSLYCNVGCKMCLFNSGKEPVHENKDPELYLDEIEIVKAIDLINTQTNLKTLVIGGGGEPFLEAASVFSLIEKTRVKEIKIYTSADWGLDKVRAQQYLDSIDEAISQRSDSVSVELNLSADSFHAFGITGSEEGYKHLSNVLDLYMRGRKTGRFNNLALHFRSISRDGSMPTHDRMIEEILVHSSYNFVETSRKENKRILTCAVMENLNVAITISYNKLMLKNKNSARDFLSAIEKDDEPFILNHMLINANGHVSLGGYYESVPLGTLLSDGTAYINDLLRSNIVAKALAEKGLSYLHRLIAGYASDFISNPPPAGTLLEVIKNIFAQPNIALYIYLGMLNDFYKEGRLDENIYTLLGLSNIDMQQYIRETNILAAGQIFDWDITRKVNWGFKSGEQEIGNLFDASPGNAHERLHFGNVWWDVGNKQQRQVMRDRVESVVNTERIKYFVTDRIKRRYGVDANVKSISVVGGFITNRSSQAFTHDLDLIVLLKNENILDFIPETPFDFGNTFDPNKLPALPSKICMWIVSEDNFSKDASNSIIVDIAQNTLSGFVIEGVQVQSEPAPVLERLKQAYFFANMIMKMAADRDLVKMLKRRYELRGMMEQLRQVAFADVNDLSRSVNIAVIDKQHLVAVQKILRNVFSQNFIDPLDKQADIDAALLGRIDSDKPSALRLFFSQKRRREILEDVSAIRNKLSKVIFDVYRVQKDFFANKPIQEQRQWIISIFKANTVSRSLEEHLAIASDVGQEYAILAGLAETTRYPSALEALYRTVLNQKKWPQNQLRLFYHILASNPMLPYSLQQELYKNFQNDKTLLLSLVSNPSLHKDVRDALKSHRNEEIAEEAKTVEDLIAKINNIILPDFLIGTYDHRENLFRYLVHKKYGKITSDNRRGVEFLLGSMQSKVKQNLTAYISQNPDELKKLYDRYKSIYNVYFKDYRGELSDPVFENRERFLEQMLHLSTVVCEKILNMYNFSNVPLYSVMPEEVFDQFMDDITRNLCAVNSRDFLVDTRQYLPAPIKVGIVTQEGMRGCSMFNSLFAMTIESYLRHEIPSWLIEVEHITCQFTSYKDIAKKKYDIIGVEVLQEEPASLQILDDFIGQVPLSDIAKQVVVYGSIFALKGAEQAIHKITTRRIRNPLMIAGEPEPGFLDVAQHTLFDKPIGDISNRVVFDGESSFSVSMPAVAHLSRIEHQMAQSLVLLQQESLSNYYIETSRGCRWNCKFCIDKKVFSKGWRPYPIGNVVAMFKELEKAGIKQVFAFDKDFWNGDYEHARALAQALIDVGNEIRFSVALRANEIIGGEELLELYKRAGLQFVFIGIESFTDEPLKRLGKGVTADANLRALHILEKHNIDFGFGYMLDPLYSFDGFLKSLEIMGKHGYWRNSTTFFGEMLFKSGIEYAEVLRKQGLLGELDPITLTYGKLYKDPKIARLVQATKWYMARAPIINFSLLPAKRSVPQTEEEQIEHDKYSKFYQMLQKANFDFLLKLAYAIRDNVSEKDLEALVDRHAKIYRDQTQRILGNLNKKIPVSCALLAYLTKRLSLENQSDVKPVNKEKLTEVIRKAGDTNPRIDSIAQRDIELAINTAA
jgi:sulfatase maturation enzyme AslB (radical SAM superfamily)